MHYSIYVYACPITSEIFYVGQDSKYGMRGLATDEHNHGAVQYKLNRLFAHGLRPITTRLCQFETSPNAFVNLNNAEIYWIAEGRKRDWPLLNCTEGGYVTSGWACHAETRAKISVANTGKKRTLEQRARIAEAHIGITASDEAKAKMSMTRKGRSLSVEHVEALKATWHETHDEETFKKISESKRGKPRGSATRATISAKLKGRPWSEARCAAQRLRRSLTRKAEPTKDPLPMHER